MIDAIRYDRTNKCKRCASDVIQKANHILDSMRKYGRMLYVMFLLYLMRCILHVYHLPVVYEAMKPANLRHLQADLGGGWRQRQSPGNKVEKVDVISLVHQLKGIGKQATINTTITVLQIYLTSCPSCPSLPRPQVKSCPGSTGHACTGASATPGQDCLASISGSGAMLLSTTSPVLRTPFVQRAFPLKTF